MKGSVRMAQLVEKMIFPDSGTTNIYNSTATMLGGGSNAYPILAEASKNLIDFRFKSAKTSGSNRALYLMTEFAGAGTGDGETIRAYTKVTANLSGSQEVHGIHATAQVGVGGVISGAIAGIRATIEATADTKNLGGKLACLNLDSNIGAGNTITGVASMIRLSKAGSVDVPFFLDIEDDQCLKGSAATGSAADALAVRLPSGTTKYISLIAAS